MEEGEYATFVTSHFLPSDTRVASGEACRRWPCGVACVKASCGLANWVMQLQALVLRLHQLSSERLSVCVFSPCTPLLEELRDQAHKATPLVLHAVHNGQLQNVTRRLWNRPMLATLHKWEIMAIQRAKVAVFLDMDIEVLPQLSLLGVPAF